MALAANALTTLNNVKTYIGITGTEWDIRLEQLINNASGLIETFCDRKFAKQDFTETICGSIETMLTVKQYPVNQILYIKIDDEEITDYSMTQNDAEKGIIYRETGWDILTKCIGIICDPSEKLRNIEISYNAGYILPKDDSPPDNPRNLPYDLEDIVLRIIRDYYNNLNFAAVQTSNGLQSFSISDITWNFGGGVKVQQLSTVFKNYMEELVMLGYKRMDL